jgi:predicted DNA-binding transcriptional regulator AlpA
MKNRTISGNLAASDNNQSSIRILPYHGNGEAWVKMRDVTRHFGMSRTTIWRNITEHQMPHHPLGTHRLRFVLSEIQEWLERTGRNRFARIGRASALAAINQTIAANPVYRTLRVQISVPDPNLSKKILKQSASS